jgi:hemerythrin-like domain-containing protein
MFDPPAPDFNDPLGLLSACHQRMLSFCKLLEKLQQHIQTHGVDGDATEAALKIHRYFSSSAVLHHMDEEQDLFPLLSQSVSMNDLTPRLLQQHEQLNALWNELAPLLAEPVKIPANRDFNVLADQFCGAYREHISNEEEQLLPRARQTLTKEQLEQMGRNMKQRRETSPAK